MSRFWRALCRFSAVAFHISRKTAIRITPITSQPECWKADCQVLLLWPKSNGITQPSKWVSTTECEFCSIFLLELLWCPSIFGVFIYVLFSFSCHRECICSDTLVLYLNVFHLFLTKFEMSLFCWFRFFYYSAFKFCRIQDRGLEMFSFLNRI